jgi:hypothetical protein
VRKTESRSAAYVIKFIDLEECVRMFFVILIDTFEKPEVSIPDPPVFSV